MIQCGVHRTEAVANSPPDAYKPPPYRAGTSRFSVQRSSKPSWAKDDALVFARSVVSEVVRLQLARLRHANCIERCPLSGGGLNRSPQHFIL